MTELVDKCIVFIAENLESVLQIQCVLNGKKKTNSPLFVLKF